VGVAATHDVGCRRAVVAPRLTVNPLALEAAMVDALVASECREGLVREFRPPGAGMFAFDLLALLNGTYEPGRASSFHGLDFSHLKSTGVVVSPTCCSTQQALARAIIGNSDVSERRSLEKPGSRAAPAQLPDQPLRGARVKAEAPQGSSAARALTRVSTGLGSLAPGGGARRYIGSGKGSCPSNPQ
jgi:hypothetical protein